MSKVMSEVMSSDKSKYLIMPKYIFAAFITEKINW